MSATIGAALKKIAVSLLTDKKVIKTEFDILLVFMFDRIVRIDNEPPFVVEWFIQHGIEVWSINEGEQRMDSYVDKLIFDL